MSLHLSERLRSLLLPLAGVLLLSPSSGDPARDLAPRAEADHSEAADDIIANHRCPCGCGNYLPGSPKTPACFGCSVGRAEVTFIRDSLAAGRTPAEVTLALLEPVLVEVFADYTDPGLAETWKRAKRAAEELEQHRVFLRPPARTPQARRTVELAECARRSRRFARVQAALIAHSGPWDTESLLRLAEEQGLEPGAMRSCLEQVDVAAQLAKDREVVSMRKIETFPALCVNRKVIPDAADALRGAIRDILLESSI